MLHAARCKCRTQKSRQNRYLGTIPQLCRALSSQLRCVSTIRKKLVKQQYLPHMPLQYDELGPLTAEICWRVLGTPANFSRFRVLAVLLHGTPVVGSAQLCGVEQRASPIFSRVAVTLGIGPHSSIYLH